MSISKNADKGSTDPSNAGAGNLKGSGKRFGHDDRTTKSDQTGNLVGGQRSKK